jgi:hypothetical protein
MNVLFENDKKEYPLTDKQKNNYTPHGKVGTAVERIYQNSAQIAGVQLSEAMYTPPEKD